VDSRHQYAWSFVFVFIAYVCVCTGSCEESGVDQLGFDLCLQANAKYPDFKHKKKQAALWLGSLWNPPWVGPELAAMAPGTVQVSIFSWNTRLIRSVEAGDYEKTLKLFQQMQQEGMIPNRFTFVPVLNACTSLQALEEGRRIHVQIMQSCCESDVYVGTSLVDMYAKCGSIEDAQRVFYRMPTPDVAAWSAMILAYVKCGQGQKALDLYQQMQKEGVKSDPITFVGVLNACASLQALEEGRHVHGQMIKSGCELNVFVGNSLIDMYTKCGCIEDARRVFDRMPTRDVAAWNAMILGHVKCGQGQKAMDLFQQMQEEGLQPSSVTFVGMLNACASVAAIEEGRSVHEQIIQSGCNLDVFIGSSLINMYANCGSIVDAQQVFNEMPAHNLITMNSMLGGYAMHGEGEEALGHFEWMCQEGAEMNTVTFVSLLAACSHADLMDEGLHYFGCMGLVYGISATVEHYACLVDLFGCAGCMHQAEELIEVMSCAPDISIPKALLSACRVHGNVEMGEQIAKRVFELDPANTASYVLLSNIYAAAGKWDLRANVQQQRLERGVNKLPG
jgi:pentatricopeptide repeat protein